MKILENELYLQNLKKTISNVIYADQLRNSKVLITGATGLVCSAIVDLMIKSNLNVSIYVACRNEKKAKERFGGLVNYVYYDATKPISFDIELDYIIHGASNASPELYVKEPVETMKANINGMENLLEYCRKKKVKKIIYVSSSEVYGKKDTLDPFKEDQYGYIDLLNSRSSYSCAKRATETLCTAYQTEYGINFNIVRLGHIYGPTASYKDKRVSSDFIFRAARGENIILKSEGKQIRSYCHCLDCASAILTVLTCGKSGEAYNISNKRSIISIRELSELIAKYGQVQLLFDIPTKLEKNVFNPMDNSSLNSAKLESLGWQGIFNADEGISNTIDIVKQIF